MTALSVLALGAAVAALVAGSVLREREVPAGGVAHRGRRAGVLGAVSVSATAVAVLTMVTSMLVVAL